MKKIDITVEELISIMSKTICHADKQARANGFRRLHSYYVKGYISMGKFQDELFEKINIARKKIGLNPYTRSEFDHACQYRIPGVERWSDARNEIVNLILGWY